MKHERRRPSVPSHAGPTRRHPTLLAGLLAVMVIAGCGSAAKRAAGDGPLGTASHVTSTTRADTNQARPLYFRPVLCQIPVWSRAPSVTALAGSDAAAANAVCASAAESSVPSTPVAGDSPGSYVILPDRSNTLRYVLGPADNATGPNSSVAVNWVSQATAEAPGQNGPYWNVVITFGQAGLAGFGKVVTRRFPSYQDGSCPASNSKCLEAIEIDGVVQSAPEIQASSYAGSAVISGTTNAEFSGPQAMALAEEINTS